MSVLLYNTLSDRKQKLEPIQPGEVSMYVCGVTVYDMCHIGHARAYVTADVIYRHLRYRGYDVTYIRNFTDVDDKIIKRANELGVSTREITEKYIQEFHTDMDALGIKRPHMEPKVTDHIPDIVELVGKLVERGHAYEVEGDVYFDVRSFPEYGKLSGRNLKDLKAGARVQVDERKRDPLDFALWKASKPGEPKWNSPWGPGRPGWHIECSAMSMKYLGETFDIHGGGRDLVFPHHENEIAQGEAATGKAFCHYFFHNGFVNIDREKMSKSLGNFFTIREINERYDPEAMRYFLLTTHYRSPINFEVDFTCPACGQSISREDLEARKCPGCAVGLDEAQAALAVRFPSLEEAQRRLYYLYGTRRRLSAFLGKAATGIGELVRQDEVEALLPQFETAMDDDFNAAAALGVLSEAMRLANEILDNQGGRPEAMITSTVQVLERVLQVMSNVLGILERDPQEAIRSLQDRAMALAGLTAEDIQRKITERVEAREAKDFARADAIREELHAKGVELMDGSGGTTWKVVG
jgi:cysteinyl-tRNA synthetase